MNSEDMVTITRVEYEALLEDSDWLSWLEAAGVDNSCAWEYAGDLRREARENAK